MPLYVQVMDWVKDHITRHAMKEGDRLPTEAALTEELGVSVVTVRRAMAELQRQGLVVRQQGRGTFVRQPRILSSPTRLGGLRETLIGPAKEVTTRLIEFRRRNADDLERLALALGAGARVWDVLRMRELDGEPAVIDHSVIPVHLATTLQRADLEDLGGSLYALLARRFGLTEGWEEQAVTAAQPQPGERRMLDLRAVDPVLVIRGTSFTAAGVPFDHFSLTYRASRFEFVLEGHMSGSVRATAGGAGGTTS